VRNKEGEGQVLVADRAGADTATPGIDMADNLPSGSDGLRTKIETNAKLCPAALCCHRDRSYRCTGMTTPAASNSVLVVDDEPMVREVVANYLQVDGFDVHEAADGDAAMGWLEQHRPALVVLDIMLPGVDGLTVLRHLRGQGDVPVILLTARAEEVDRIIGLELGADDYVVKPFSPRELSARVRTVLRRTNAAPGAAGPIRAYDALEIDERAREVKVDGALVVLTPKEFDLLAFLAAAPRQVFSRRQLLEHVWDSKPDYQDPATVTVHIGRLRQKIERNPDEPRWLTTVWGVGYRFEP
jgi:DNA-binding response OmpR family regulator